MDSHQFEVPFDKARRTFDQEIFASLPSDGAQGMLGRERAEQAIDFGLAMHAHLFLVGPGGTGKRTYIRNRLASWAPSQPAPDDWCFIPNFEREDEPRALSLPAGRGRSFQRGVEQFVQSIHRELRAALDSEAYTHHRQTILHAFEVKQQEIWDALLAQARDLGFAVQTAPTGQVLTLPLGPDGQPFRPEEFQEIPETIRKGIQERQAQLAEPLEMTLHRMRTLERDARLEIQKSEQEVAKNAGTPLLEVYSAPYREMPSAHGYFSAILQDVLQHLDDLRHDDNDSPEGWVTQYAVHLLVEHEPHAGAPVIFETHPTLSNLFGQMNYKQSRDGLVARLEGIAAGSLMRANGGYLVLWVEDLLQEPYAYGALKRALRQGWANIENAPEGLGWMRPVFFRPEPIPLDVTVVLMGPAHIYYALYNYDPDFRRLFKIKADFAADMPASRRNLRELGQILSEACHRSCGARLNTKALAALAEFAAERAEHQERLTTQLGEVLSLLEEAQVWASGAPVIDGSHVAMALQGRRERSAGPADYMHRLIADGTLLITTEGFAVGQVNGLAVMSAGDAPFGHPSRITAAVWAGERGIVDIERQAHQSGSTHTKGVLTLSGFFSGRFGANRRLALGASIAFEQMYDEVDGDSASSAELYALMSALSGYGINQGIAVTGSIDQYGMVQPIGGVNHKIEGFFEACRLQGLSGKQGVLIPSRNLRTSWFHQGCRQR
ncbi:Lon protease family protein [Sulfobacillus harzensis]|uniref:Lon protease family protein n=1 Tax=Sulfobacillus harzensis TaxID=2729629 RepID=UPI001FAC52C1|nr:AAA family ATPase [Sulfobacillus harzensis]